MNVLTTTSSFSELDNEAARELDHAGIQLIVNPLKRRLSEVDAIELYGKYNPVGVVAGVETISTAVITAAPALKTIARCGTGLDNVDMKAAQKAGVSVTNTPDAPAAAVSELTIALMLNLLRRVSETDRQMRQGEWKPLMGGLLSGRTVGLIGYGRIGKRVAHLLKPWNCRIIAHDPLAEGDDDATLVALQELLTTSDIISLHAPSGAVWLDFATFSRMKPQALLINTARGDLIDEAALANALREGQLAGAALDVFENEPYSGELTTLPNALLTSHMGSYAAEGRAMQERESLANLVASLKQSGVIA